MDIILYAVPFFFALIGIELIAEKLRDTDYYRLNDALTSLATGTINQLVNVSKLLIPFTFYLFVYEHFALFWIPETWLTWVIAFIAYDFCYYWNHRLGHEMNLLWAAHVVHHSSEEFNLTTALRQTGTSFLSFVFYLPMALIGIEPTMLLTVGALNLIYQYWVHTRHIDKLGWMEAIFVTPSNHRCHHAQNDIYIDRNYGGVFIVWDRLFGSYQAELDHDKPIFGIRGALQSWNPIWANLQIYNQLWLDCWHTRSRWHKLTLWFRRTGWRPPDVVARFPLTKTPLAQFKKFDTQLTGMEKGYAFLQYLVNTGLSLWMLLSLDQLTAVQQLVLIGFVFYSAYSIGVVLERREYAVKTEAIKFILLFALCWWLTLPKLTIILLSLAISVSLGLIIATHRRDQYALSQ